MGQAALEGAVTESARLEDALAEEFLGQGRDGEGGMQATEVQQGLGRRGVQGAEAALVTAGLVVEGGELAVLEAIDPGFDRFGGVETPVPRLLGGFLEGAGQSESALAGLADHLDGREAGQGTAFAGRFVAGGGRVVHALPVWRRGRRREQ